MYSESSLDSHSISSRKDHPSPLPLSVSAQATSDPHPTSSASPSLSHTDPNPPKEEKASPDDRGKDRTLRRSLSKLLSSSKKDRRSPIVKPIQGHDDSDPIDPPDPSLNHSPLDSSSLKSPSKSSLTLDTQSSSCGITTTISPASPPPIQSSFPTTPLSSSGASLEPYWSFQSSPSSTTPDPPEVSSFPISYSSPPSPLVHPTLSHRRPHRSPSPSIQSQSTSIAMSIATIDFLSLPPPLPSHLTFAEFRLLDALPPSSRHNILSLHQLDSHLRSSPFYPSLSKEDLRGRRTKDVHKVATLDLLSASRKRAKTKDLLGGMFQKKKEKRRGKSYLLYQLNLALRDRNPSIAHDILDSLGPDSIIRKFPIQSNACFLTALTMRVEGIALFLYSHGLPADVNAPIYPLPKLKKSGKKSKSKSKSSSSSSPGIFISPPPLPPSLVHDLTSSSSSSSSSSFSLSPTSSSGSSFSSSSSSITATSSHSTFLPHPDPLKTEDPLSKSKLSPSLTPSPSPTPSPPIPHPAYHPTLSYFLLTLSLGLDNLARFMIRTAHVNKDWYGLTPLHILASRSPPPGSVSQAQGTANGAEGVGVGTAITPDGESGGSEVMISLLLDHGALPDRPILLSQYRAIKRLASPALSKHHDLMEMRGNDEEAHDHPPLPSKNSLPKGSKPLLHQRQRRLLQKSPPHHSLKKPSSNSKRPSSSRPTYAPTVGILPLDLAAARLYLPSIMALLQRMTRYMVASSRFCLLVQQDLCITTHLLAAGADPSQRTKEGSSPLHLAARMGELSLVLLYLSLGVEVDLRGENSWTPLHEAISQGNEVMVRALLNRGANPQTKTSAGHDAKALGLACGWSEAQCDAMLDTSKIDRTVEDKAFKAASSLWQEAVCARHILDQHHHHPPHSSPLTPGTPNLPSTTCHPPQDRSSQSGGSGPWDKRQSRGSSSSSSTTASPTSSPSMHPLPFGGGHSRHSFAGGTGPGCDYFSQSASPLPQWSSESSNGHAHAHPPQSSVKSKMMDRMKRKAVLSMPIFGGRFRSSSPSIGNGSASPEVGPAPGIGGPPPPPTLRLSDSSPLPPTLSPHLVDHVTPR